MGKLLRGSMTLVILVALMAGGLYWYVQPQQTLDLAYSELPVRKKLTEMIASRRLEVELTEPEVNSLLKKALVSQLPNRQDVEITGAQFTLLGSQWVADVNLLYREQWKIGATLYFTVSWQEPYLTTVHTGTRIRQIELPLDWFRLKPIQAQLNDYLPKLAGVRSIAFQDHGLKVSLKLR